MVLRVVGLSLTALLCQTFFWSPGTHWALKAVVAAIALLAAIRPGAALLWLAVLVPFGRVIPIAMSESGSANFTRAVVLAFLVGWFWYRLRHADDGRPNEPGLVLGMLFAAVLTASLLVEIGVLRYWKDYWWPYAGMLLTHFCRDYITGIGDFRPWTRGVGGLVSLHFAAIFLEGLGLMRAAHVLCAGDAAFRGRLLRVLALAAVGTALLSTGRVLELSLAEGRSLLSVLETTRISVHVSKVNAAASSFVLFLPILIGMAVWAEQPARRQFLLTTLRWVATAVGAGVLLASLWMTGSRTAMITGTAVALGACAHAIMKRSVLNINWRSGIVVVAATGVVVAFLGLGLSWKTDRAGRASPIGVALDMRVLIWRTTLRMVTTHPVFGVGIGQFSARVGAFKLDDALLAYFRSGGARFSGSSFNAHNQFLQMAAELGLIGGALFAGMFAAILWSAWKAFRKSRDALLGGAIAGVVAFLITCLAGQPLLYEVVAYPFWLVLGVVLAAGDAGAPAVSANLAELRRRSRLMAWFLVALAVSIPVRVWQGHERVNLALANYGFSEWHKPAKGQPYSLVRDAGTFFTYGHARWLEVSIRRDVKAGPNRLDVAIALDGRRARTLTLTDNEWHTAKFMIPADAKHRFRRIDIEIRAPASVPAQVRVARPLILEDLVFERGGAPM